jgi:DNA processing protein
MNSDSKEIRLWMALNSAPGIGPARFHQILKQFGSLDRAFGAGAADWSAKIPSLNPTQAGAALAAAQGFDFQRELDLLGQWEARVLRFCDEDFPSSLLPLHAPAPLLYVRGSLPGSGKRSVAVVGTRSPTPYGLDQCRVMVSALAAEGLQIISGLAKGIDAAAHLACVDLGAKTFGVLGSGLNALYPSQNKGLAERMIAGGGGVISQFSMDASPERYHFPMRNALISGLSSAVLVLEGEEDSGSLITAEWALEQGRDIYALPGPVDARFSRGPNRLIQQGAKLVLDARDILSEFPEFRDLSQAPRAKKPVREELTGEESKIFKALSEAGRMAVDQLASKTGLPAAQLSASLTMLEIKGAVRQLPGTMVEAL